MFSFQGVTYPSLNSLWASWAPPLEYSKLTSLTISGSSAGIVFAMPVSGLIIEHFGWPAVFYINGFFGVIWFAFWMYFVTDKPEDDPRITQQEIDFIKFSINSNSQNKVWLFLNNFIIKFLSFFNYSFLFYQEIWCFFFSSRIFHIHGKPCCHRRKYGQFSLLISVKCGEIIPWW